MRQTKQEIFRRDYRPSNYWVRWVDLAFLVEQDHTLVRTRILFKQNTEATDNSLFLHGSHLSLQRLSIDGREVPVDDLHLTDEGLLLRDLPEQFELRSEVKIYPGENTALEGLYQSGEFFLTQCEAQGFRRITYYPDRPDVLAPFAVTIVADKSRYPVLLSNGNCIEKVMWKEGVTLPSGRTLLLSPLIYSLWLQVSYLTLAMSSRLCLAARLL